MTQTPEAFIFLPPPKQFELRNSSSEISSALFRKIEPTRTQLIHPPEAVRLIRSESRRQKDGYHLEVRKTAIDILASGEEGWHNGLSTLRQLAMSADPLLPLCSIDDYPDFEHRAVMLDISRNKVPKLETLFDLIDTFSQWKINELQLYVEHAFAYEGHQDVWENASPLTPTDILKLDAYCQERFIELIPNLNCFGHMSRWLIHERYQPLSEQPEGGHTDLGYRKIPQGLCATDPQSIILAEDIITQMVSHFRSTKVNVGCDETIDLGYGRSKEIVEAKGRGTVYLDYLKQIYQICRKNNRSMQFWADIIVRYPDLMSQIPSDCVALNWGYESIHPFEKETTLLKASGISYYVCPGTSSWCSIGGRTDNMIANIRSSAKHGKHNGAIGLMVTDWGDNGHLQPLLSSYPGFVHGAVNAWQADSNNSIELTLDKFVFNGSGWGQLLLELGNLDKPLGIYIHNHSILYKLLQSSPDEIKNRSDINLTKLKSVLEMAESISDRITALSIAHPTDSIFEKEFKWVTDILTHACHRGLAIHNLSHLDLPKNTQILREKHKEIWDARNRPGGYSETREYFNTLESS
jgi:hexosaminidase